MSLKLPNPKQIWKLHTGNNIRENHQVLSNNEVINKTLMSIMEDQLAGVKINNAKEGTNQIKSLFDSAEGSSEISTQYKIKKRESEGSKAEKRKAGTISDIKENININKKRRVFGTSSNQRKKYQTEAKKTKMNPHRTEYLCDVKKKLIFLSENEAVLSKSSAVTQQNQDKTGPLACLPPNPNIFYKKKNDPSDCKGGFGKQVAFTGLFDQYLLSEFGNIDNKSFQNSTFCTEFSEESTFLNTSITSLNSSNANLNMSSSTILNSSKMNCSFVAPNACLGSKNNRNSSSTNLLPEVNSGLGTIFPGKSSSSTLCTTGIVLSPPTERDLDRKTEKEKSLNTTEYDKKLTLLNTPLNNLAPKTKEINFRYSTFNELKPQRFFPSFKDSIKSALLNVKQAGEKQEEEKYAFVFESGTVPEGLKYMPYWRNPSQTLNRYIPVLPKCFLEEK